MAVSFNAPKVSSKRDAPDIGKEHDYDNYAYHYVEAGLFRSLETE